MLMFKHCQTHSSKKNWEISTALSLKLSLVYTEKRKKRHGAWTGSTWTGDSGGRHGCRLIRTHGGPSHRGPGLNCFLRHPCHTRSHFFTHLLSTLVAWLNIDLLGYRSLNVTVVFFFTLTWYNSVGSVGFPLSTF